MGQLNTSAAMGAGVLLFGGGRMAFKDLDIREQAFVDEYIKNGGSCRKAAIEAGYSKATAKNANYWLKPHDYTDCRLPYKPYLKQAIDERLKEIKDASIADATEVLQALTATLRKQSVSYEVVVEGTGDGTSEAREVEKRPSEKDVLKAAELLGKVYGLYKDKVEQDVDMELNVTIDYGD